MSMLRKKDNIFYFTSPERTDIRAGFISGLYQDWEVAVARGIPEIRRGCYAYMRQVHGTRVMDVKEGGEYEGDGLFSSCRGLLLVVRTADCMPLLFFEPNKGVCGAVHMGWRGAAEGILDDLPTDLADYRVFLGPGLRKCCYRVGEEFLFYDRISPFIERSDKGLFFDAVGYAIHVLTEKGVNPSNISDAGVCTFCSREDLPSHRKNGTSCRTVSFISVPRRKTTLL